MRARVQQQLARRRVRVVGDVEHGAGADVDVAVDEHASKHPPAGRLGKRAFALASMKNFDHTPAGPGPRTLGARPARLGSDPHGWGQTRTVGVRPRVCSRRGEGGPTGRGSMLARLRSLRTRGRRVVRPGAACARASVQASASESCTLTLARPAVVRAAARRCAAGPKGRRVRRSTLPPPLRARTGRARADRRAAGPHQVVVTAGDQDDGTRCMQLEASRRLGRPPRARRV